MNTLIELKNKVDELLLILPENTPLLFELSGNQGEINQVNITNSDNVNIVEFICK